MTMLKAIIVITLLSAVINSVLTEPSSTEDGAEVSELVQARSCQEFLTSKLLLYLLIANMYIFKLRIMCTCVTKLCSHNMQYW